MNSIHSNNSFIHLLAHYQQNKVRWFRWASGHIVAPGEVKNAVMRPLGFFACALAAACRASLLVAPVLLFLGMLSIWGWFDHRTGRAYMASHSALPVPHLESICLTNPSNPSKRLQELSQLVIIMSRLNLRPLWNTDRPMLRPQWNIDVKTYYKTGYKIGHYIMKVIYGKLAPRFSSFFSWIFFS